MLIFLQLHHLERQFNMYITNILIFHICPNDTYLQKDMSQCVHGGQKIICEVIFLCHFFVGSGN